MTVYLHMLDDRIYQGQQRLSSDLIAANWLAVGHCTVTVGLGAR
jgi:hypothetical protein